MNKNNKRNNVITIIALIVGILAISLGFAAFSNTLNLSQAAAVRPDASNFKVVFTKTSGTIDESNVIPTKTPTTISAENGLINNDIEPTLSNLYATFTVPGQKVEYDLYVYNAGEYLAYLNSVTFKGTKICTPATGTTATLVSSACNGITVTLNLGNDTYTGTTQNIQSNSNITNKTLAAGASQPAKVTIEYASNAARADGPFTVEFPDISLYYMSAGGTNETVASKFSGTIYRNTSDQIYIGDSIVTGDEVKAWCAVSHVHNKSTCTEPQYFIPFESKAECESTVEYMKSSEDAMIRALANAAECEIGSYSAKGLPSGYETSASNISENFYLKHVVVNNIVRESYACIRYDTNKEACVRGGNASYYGTYDGISNTQINSVAGLNPTGNIVALENVRSYFESQNGGSCHFSNSYSSCSDSSLNLFMFSNGSVDSADYSGIQCEVSSEGYSNCS